MKRLEIFPREERRAMTAEIMHGGYTTSFESLTEESIYRLKQLLLKYFRAIPEEKLEMFGNNECPLCASFLNNKTQFFDRSTTDPYSSCILCPWRDKYSDEEFSCSDWAKEYDCFTFFGVMQNKEAINRRIAMIYQWIEEYMEEL
jgi:hypothetical protein